jgi:hypothetical protein
VPEIMAEFYIGFEVGIAFGMLAGTLFSAIVMMIFEVLND